ncbi:SRPBCC family protein [Microlunatus aurantiacus]|uniref:SRPBCC family protein n=1 Tax=Microlunatus aurantiacus TaxID=446786 RepID=A0ABP7DWZ7_9ACTN
MSVDLRVSQDIAAPSDLVWSVLVDWEGQRRWIPFTTVRVIGDRHEGLGVRCVALSGFWLGRLPIGLLDRFVVTAWEPPTDDQPGLLEVLHLGPFFTGPGTFVVHTAADGGSVVRCAEIFDVAGGSLPTRLAGLLLPVMRAGFATSLRALGRVCVGRVGSGGFSSRRAQSS